jgi:hypothetical protein
MRRLVFGMPFKAGVAVAFILAPQAGQTLTTPSTVSRFTGWGEALLSS